MTNVRWLLNADAPKNKPLKVQMEALSHSYPKMGWAHFMDMGLGKTTVALNEFCMFQEDYDLNRMLVLAPNNFKPDWEREANLFRFPFKCHTFDSSDRDAATRWMRKYENEPLMMAVNYEALIYPKTIKVIDDFLSGGKTYLAIDESIQLKNPNSEYFKAAYKIAAKCLVKRDLSGKPTTQGPHDMFTQLKIIGALDGWNYLSFRNRYCVMGGFKGKEIVGLKNQPELTEYIKNWAFIASSNDYRTWPHPQYTTRDVKITKEQLEIHRSLERDFLVDLGEGRIVTAEMVITRLNKMQQIASGFIIDDDGKPHDIIPLEKNPRIAAVKKVLDEEISGKLIVGVYHRHAAEMLLEALKPYNPVAIRGKSDTSDEEIAANKAKFNRDNSSRVLVGQLIATKYGHTLLGTEDVPCHHTAFYENMYSLDTRSQFEKRNDRTGQRFGVTYIDFIVEGSNTDRRVIKALQEKEDVAAAILRFSREKGVLAGVTI